MEQERGRGGEGQRNQSYLTGPALDVVPSVVINVVDQDAALGKVAIEPHLLPALNEKVLVGGEPLGDLEDLGGGGRGGRGVGAGSRDDRGGKEAELKLAPGAEVRGVVLRPVEAPVWC